MPAPYTVEALERERQQRLKEAIANEPSKKDKEEKRDRLAAQVDSWRRQKNGTTDVQTCTSYADAEAVLIKAIKAEKDAPDLRLDLTRLRLSVVPADVLRLGDSLVELSLVGNAICELPADLDLCKRLKVLNCAANELSGLPNLAGLRELSHVGLGYNCVNDAALPALNRSLPTCLQSLDLSANELLDLSTFIDLFEDKFAKLYHLSLQHNPLAIRPGYKTDICKSALGANLTLIDNVEVTPEIRDGVKEEAAAPAAAPAEETPPAAEEGGGEEAEEEEEEEDDDEYTREGHRRREEEEEKEMGG